MRKKVHGLALWLIFASIVSEAPAEVSEGERRFAAQLAQAVTVGKIQYLGTEGQPFLAIFTAATTPKPHGGVIFLHDLGAHADWAEVISPLRTQLPKYGWHTLSVQAPTELAYTSTAQLESLQQEIHQRIQKAIEFCHSQRIFNIVLAGHRFGAIMAADFVAQKTAGGDNPISAVVAMSLFSPTAIHLNVSTNDAILKISTPFLDVSPAQSSGLADQQAAQRKASMAKISHDKYKQILIIGTDYTFSGAEATLLNRIQSWLKKQAPGMELQPESPAPAIQPTASTANK